MPEENIEERNKEFLNLFRIEGQSDFFGPTPFNEGFGFSIKKNYNSRVKRILPEVSGVDEDFFALFHVYIDDEELKREGSRKAIGVRSAMVKGVERLRFPENPQINWPVEIVSKNHFFFDVQTGHFFEKDLPIEPINILKNVYESHIKPSKKWQGLYFRTKKRSLEFGSALCVILVQILVHLARLLFNEKYSLDPARRAAEARFPNLFKKDQPQLKGNLPPADQPLETFFGYKASRWSLFMYCAIHLIAFFLFKDSTNFSFMRLILSNAFLGAVYAFFSLCLYEKYAPLSLKFSIKWLTLLALWIQERPLSV